MDEREGVAEIVSDKAALWLWEGEDESLTITVKLKDPEIVGTPKIDPEGESDSPVGRNPPPSDHE